ncbi:hypothetical protein [Nitrosarchaeum sp. AC2]|uniref:hypothetical protein n=1 Tax=Nitrosarchaeum sp. AC2 TaxID=2259673 RepID=UPI0015CD5F4E|nr:hypothetical protein [Nitrosarchaeum sp. AC2]QLH10261.1 hypothetical protein DSQ20_01130 [Nitrosarchaeum sp. AC2]
MVYRNTLSATQKDKKIPFIIDRDGNVCFYDKMPFVNEIPGLRRTIDHANNNEQDNRIENLLLAHWECNEKKKTNVDMQFIAKDALIANIRNASESLSEGEKHTETHKDIDELKEGDINLIVNKLVLAELESQFSNKNDCTGISYNRSLKKIHYLLITQTGGRGSEQAVRRSLDAYCSDYAPWKSEKLGKGNRIIRRRKPDELG